MDVDVHAYASLDDLTAMCYKNRLHEIDLPQLQEEIANRRFVIVNAWRNIGQEPASRAPLGLYRVKYDDWAFPLSSPLPSSRWYTFPDVKPDELLIFCQYDRDVRQPSDLWHGALMDIGQGERYSMDLRCLVVFEETIPEKYDRFAHKLVSKLNFDESAKFCSQQAERRRSKSGS